MKRPSFCHNNLQHLTVCGSTNMLHIQDDTKRIWCGSLQQTYFDIFLSRADLNALMFSLYFSCVLVMLMLSAWRGKRMIMKSTSSSRPQLLISVSQPPISSPVAKLGASQWSCGMQGFQWLMLTRREQLGWSLWCHISIKLVGLTRFLGDHFG